MHTKTARVKCTHNIGGRMLRILYYLCKKSGKISTKGGWAYNTSWAYNTYSYIELFEMYFTFHISWIHFQSVILHDFN